MRYKNLSTSFIVLLLIAALYVTVYSIEAKDTYYTPHEAIIIQSNDDFTSENGVVGGSGTANDPYIIEGLEIAFNTSSYMPSNIFISNTTAHVIVRNCKLVSSNESLLGMGSLITLSLVENVRFENITSTDGFATILCSNVSNSVFKHCDVNFMMLMFSSNNTISYCKFSPGGTFYLTLSKNNHIDNNNFLFQPSSGLIVEDGNEWSNNYWKYYSGQDNNKDGIGDIPYTIPNTNDKDNYPKMQLIPNAGNLYGYSYEENHPPIADFYWNPESPKVGEKVQFFDDSTDPDGDNIISWHWDFGDNSISDKKNPTHYYNETPSLGYYVVTLTVTDSRGASGSTSKFLVVGGENITNQKPTIRITNPKKGEKVSGKVNITGTASDPDGIVSSIQVRVGSKEWYNATIIYNYTTGNVTWYYIWDSSNVIPGEVTIRAKAIDLQGGESNEATVTVTVEKTSSGGGGGTPGFEIILLFIAIILVLLLSKRKQQ